LDIPVRVPVKLLPDDKAALHNKAVHRALVADVPWFGSGGTFYLGIERRVVASVERPEEPVLDTAGILEGAADDVAVVDGKCGLGGRPGDKWYWNVLGRLRSGAKRHRQPGNAGSC